MTQQTTLDAKHRDTPYLKYAMWLAISLITAALIAYFIFKKFSRQNMNETNAMNCGISEPAQFEKRLANYSSVPIYTPKKGEPSSPVTFKFNLSPIVFKDTILIIKSYKVYLPVYRAPYQDKIVIQAGMDLLNNDGFDSFEVRLLNPNTHESCTAVHETTPFWQANKTVYMDFLPDRELDKHERPVSFKVRIE